MKEIIKHRELLFQLTKREIATRYKGSYLGLFWFIVQPLLMLVVYTFVFSVVFKARWGATEANNLEYSLILFSGITTYNLFSDIISRAPNLITSNTNYVKKVVFPLELLPLVTLLSSLFFSSISYVILLVFIFIMNGGLNWTTVMLPIIILPLCFLSLGLSWIVSSLGVFFRDINHLVGVLLTALMFLSPVFYPVESVPENMRIIYSFNPLSYVIEEVRNILLVGTFPHIGQTILGLLISITILVIGYKWFVKTKRGFSDVL
ncbi:ABC transporter permease [Paenibacillus lautus]|uniref:ABC transporter permease n=1 Tax=Paenibacillus lautus TaxID=1401 RepID=UPI001C1130B7|nr:ABC transporter permease [Paenibacillus lautus]MBU5349342.1 ABC transporter permease [Paenibacillus lautus]